MKWIFTLFITVFLLLYGMINFYIGLRGWQAIGRFLPYLNRYVYWFLFWCLSLAYPVARIGRGVWPDNLRWLLTIAGSYWLGAMFYLLQILLAIDLLRVLDRWLHFWPQNLRGNARLPFYTGILVVVLLVVVLVYGTWNARHPVVRHYDIAIDKKAGELTSLRVVMVSDIHLGEIIHNGRLLEMVETINSLDPDLILLPGDVIDEDVGPFVKQDMSATFRRITPRFGIYAVPGNHEYIGGSIQQALYYLEQAGITVLRDSYAKVADSFYIVGRDDLSRSRIAPGTDVQTLARVMEGIDHSLPIIMLNHQPVQLGEALREGVDLQLSGHTHRGQLFPNQLITGRMFELDWGFLKKDSLQAIVSSGFGTWGPPVRLGNRPEIVDITITFQDKE